MHYRHEVAPTVFHTKAVVPLLWISSFSDCVWEFCVRSLFCYALIIVIFSFVFFVLKKRELIALRQLSSCCYMAVMDLSLFLMVPWADMQVRVSHLLAILT